LMPLAVGGAFRGAHGKVQRRDPAASAVDEKRCDLWLIRCTEASKGARTADAAHRLVIVLPWAPRNAPPTAKRI
ncbi:MAG TPA: hypothetical protein VJV05_17175, partial [Pyrinomonadaceae bacterium]|nr:hypothetical protein [Pyrinomonadaceae bacterium]